jgi:transposase, IS5 family
LSLHGNRGDSIKGVRILRSHQKRGITKALKAMIKRRSAIEPTIGHMRWTAGWVATRSRARWATRCMVLCGAGHNLRLILAALRLLCARLGLSMQAVIEALLAAPRNHRLACD